MFTITAEWKGDMSEEFPDAISAQQRAEAILAEHPNATVKIEGPGFSATINKPSDTAPAA